ncbi:hypothetical protein ACHAPT_006072 [Fusarium lateritium]
MKGQLFILPVLQAAAAALEPVGHGEFVHGSWCFTYLSTYLAPVQTDNAGPDTIATPSSSTAQLGPAILPPFVTNQSTTSTVASSEFSAPFESSEITQILPSGSESASSSGVLVTLPDDENLEPTAPNDLSPSNTETSNQASTTSSEAGVPGQAIIFLVSPSTEDQRRHVAKRAPGGFVRTGNVANAETCTDAAVFSLASGQLLDQGAPIYYSSGETYKLLSGQGPPPDAAITTTFAIAGGSLGFSDTALPNGQASFCQDPDSGQVYITFLSAPPGCLPVSLTVYGGNGHH